MLSAPSPAQSPALRSTQRQKSSKSKTTLEGPKSAKEKGPKSSKALIPVLVESQKSPDSSPSVGPAKVSGKKSSAKKLEASTSSHPVTPPLSPHRKTEGRPRNPKVSVQPVTDGVVDLPAKMTRTPSFSNSLSIKRKNSGDLERPDVLGSVPNELLALSHAITNLDDDSFFSLGTPKKTNRRVVGSFLLWSCVWTVDECV